MIARRAHCATAAPRPSRPPRREGHPNSRPDLLPRAGERLAPDGGTAQHPIHDDDLEDRDPEDFEHDIEDIDEAAAVDTVLRRRD